MTPRSEGPDRRSVGVVIPAAGSGERMGGRPKALLTLAGTPILRRSLEPFLAHPRVVAVALAVSVETAANPPIWLASLDERVQIVTGGRTRGASVRSALAALGPVDCVVVHDAARPFVTRAIIDRCLAATSEGMGAVAGWPMEDTVKEVDPVDRVIRTLDRSVMWRAQTPQAFPAAEIIAAYDVGGADTATDDAEVFVRYGGEMRMVRGAPWNLKITRPEDLALAELIAGHPTSRAEP